MTTQMTAESPFWASSRSRAQRLAMTGPNNVNYKHGKYTNWRRWHLEKPLNEAARLLTPAAVWRLTRRIAALPASVRVEAQARLEALGELLPDHWALRDERRPIGDPRWYVPRRAWPACVRFLRAVRALYRGVALCASSMPSAMPTTGSRDRRDIPNGSSVERSERLEQRRWTELARFRDWCQRQGLDPVAPT